MPTDSTHPAELLESLLAESRELTAIERFSKVHDEGDMPEQAKYYQDLIPLSTPGEGEQYAFDVDLDLCSGCKACVSACHSLNGLEEEETWRAVGQLHGQSDLPIVQHVTTACHHCVDPGCLSGCPTNAYEKDPVTGVVRHLDDQCFGCQYCTMACPYEVPQYSVAKGIVRKCDMCHDRLSEGEAPACVQACPNKAIRISVVNTDETVARTTAGKFLPATPPSQLTNPTTIYRTKRSLPEDLQAADADHASPQHAHLPLVVMLVFTQVSVGAVAFAAFARWIGYGTGADLAIVLGTLIGLAGLGAATLHLGRPHLAFRAVLGWRHSWLSREAILFGVYALFAKVSTAYALLPYAMEQLPEWLPKLEAYGLPHVEPAQIESFIAMVLPTALRPGAEILAVLFGAIGIYCSGMIYVFTGREFWQGLGTFVKFGGTPFVLGPAVLLATVTSYAAYESTDASVTWIVISLILASLAKLAYEVMPLIQTHEPGESLRLTKRLMLKQLRSLTFARFGLGLVGGVLLPALVLLIGAGSWASAVIAVAALGCLLLGELAERGLYFSAVIPLRMPGGVKS